MWRLEADFEGERNGRFWVYGPCKSPFVQRWLLGSCAPDSAKLHGRDPQSLCSRASIPRGGRETDHYTDAMMPPA